MKHFATARPEVVRLSRASDEVPKSPGTTAATAGSDRVAGAGSAALIARRDASLVVEVALDDRAAAGHEHQHLSCRAPHGARTTYDIARHSRRST